jgi:DNA-binding GntR family transcriptional regulator
MADAKTDMRLVRDRPTLRELTAEKLREAIVSSRLAPGQRLVERDLCEQTGVSRSSLREALRQLEAEGLVVRQGPRGLFVASITPEEARQIYEVRAAIEPEMARLFAARATQEDFARLSKALVALERAIAARSIADYVKALDSFFDALISGSGNSVALRIVSGLRARISYLRTITTARADTNREKETLKLMRKIADDARRRDGEAVAASCRAFVERSAAFALGVLAEHHHDRAASERQS